MPLASIWTICIERASAETFDGVTPVSYTHLDVYKRQEFWETLKDTAVNMVFLAAAGATVAAIILLLLKAPAIAPEILPLLPTLMNLLRVKIA